MTKIEAGLLNSSPYLKEVSVQKRDAQWEAVIYPDLELLKKADIINIYEEIKWYGIELYNMEVQEEDKIRGFEIVTRPFLHKQSRYSEHEESDESEPDNEVYRGLKAYLSSVSDKPVYPSSHLELDLGLDSLEYVMLFEFIEKSYGVHLDERMFAQVMVMSDLYERIKKHKKKSDVTGVDWSDILKHKSKEQLLFSPKIMMIWKFALLPFFRLYFRLRVIGREKLPKSPFIIAPAHYSMLDGFVILASLPCPILQKSFFLAYEGEFGTPRLKPIAKHSQMLLIDIDKDLKASLQRTALPLIESQNLVIFPEHARSRDGRLLPFKKFFAILSKELDVPIVPTVIEGTFEALPAGQLFPRPKKVTVKFLEPIYPGDESYDALSRRIKRAIQAEI